MAGSSDPSNDSKRSFSKVKDDIYFFKRDELLNCLETTIDQCMKVGATYRESKRQVKTLIQNLVSSEKRNTKRKYVLNQKKGIQK